MLRARVCLFFRGTDTRARIKLAYIRQKIEAGVRSRRFKLTGLKSIVITPMCMCVCARAHAVTRETHVSARLVNSKKKYLIGRIFNIYASLDIKYCNRQIYRIWRANKKIVTNNHLQLMYIQIIKYNKLYLITIIYYSR